ncbi:hypothetical protein Btru_067116 [Bulinus truncatus]|nr:hypothetical protein Btru_067116 [Bulinus truncatus]
MVTAGGMVCAECAGQYGKMFSAVLMAFLSTFISPTMSAVSDDCMVPVTDLASAFGQEGATSTTAALFESSENCNVVVYEAAGQETESQCRLYACRPLTSCSFQPVGGRALFTRQDQGDTSPKTDPAVTTGMPGTATPSPDVAETGTTHATQNVEVTTTPITSESPKEDVKTTATTATTQPAGRGSETALSSLETKRPEADPPVTAVPATATDPPAMLVDGASTQPTSISTSSVTPKQPGDEPPSSANPQPVDASTSPSASNTTSTGPVASVSTTVQNNSPLTSDLDTSTSPTPSSTLSSISSSSTLSSNSSSLSSELSSDSPNFTNQSPASSSSLQQDPAVIDKMTTSPVSSTSPVTTTESLTSQSPRNQSSLISPIPNTSESLPQPTSSDALNTNTTTSSPHAATSPDTPPSSSVITSPTSAASTLLPERSANQTDVNGAGIDTTTTRASQQYNNVTSSLVPLTTENTLQSNSSLEMNDTLRGNDVVMSLIEAAANQRPANETLTEAAANQRPANETLTEVAANQRPANETLTEAAANQRPANETLTTGGKSVDAPQAIVAILAITLALGCVFLLVVLGVLGRRVYEGYQKRHYSRLDYLINGMYN